MKPSRRYLWRDTIAVLILCFALVAQVHGQAVGEVGRDWKLHPAVAEWPVPHQLYALGDVHGDYDRVVELLVGAHLIAADPATPLAVQWTGGSAVLVCTGDMIDKYNHGLSVIAMMRALEPLAKRAGGGVIVTMGNHEAEFLASGGGAAKAADFAQELTSAGVSASAVAAGKDSLGIGQWLRDLPVAAKVGDWFFCHAGNTGGLTVAQLDEQIAAQVGTHGFDVPILIGSDSLLEARMHPRPWWDWDGEAPMLKDALVQKESKHSLTTPGVDSGENRLRAGIQALGAQHLVFGHQPGKMNFADGTVREAGAMFQKFDGLVFFIDTGMSRGVSSGRGALLRITDGSVHGAAAVYADGTTLALVR